MSSIARQRPEVHTAFHGRYRFGNKEAPDPVEGRRPSESRPFGSLDHAYMARTDLTLSDKLVMMALPAWAGRRDQCFPAEATVAARIGVTSRTVRTALKHLLALQLIGIVKTKSNPTGRVLVLRYARPGVRPDQATVTPAPSGKILPGKPDESPVTRKIFPGGAEDFSPKKNPSGRVETIDRFAAPVEEGTLDVGEGAGVLPPIQAAAPEAIALFTALEVVQAVSGAAPATVAPPLAVPPAPAPSKSPAAPEAPAAARSAEERAWAVWSDLYAGFCPTAAAADWRVWRRKYMTIIKRLDADEISEAMVARATKHARSQNDHITRGRRFMAGIDTLADGHQLATDEKPTPTGEKPTPGPPRMSPADAARAVARYGNTSRQSLPQPAPYDPADRILSGAEFNEEMRRLCPDVYRQIDARKAAKAIPTAVAVGGAAR